MSEIYLKGVTTSLNQGCFKVTADVSGAETIWFELGEQYQSMLDTQSLDAFFILYVWLAMEMGVDLRVEGPVSKRLSDSVLNHVKNMFLTLCPRLRDINITVLQQVACPSNDSNHSATGFSGGVDSWYTALKAIESGSPYTYYLFANTGQHGEHDAQKVFFERAQVAEKIARTLDKPFITVNSNIDSVFKERFQQRHSISNLACALLLQKGFSQYAYASGFTAKDSAVVAHKDMAIMDAFLLPFLSTERMTFVSCGDEASRIEKLDYISTFKQFRSGLYVCTEKYLPVKNCGHCFKCRRTQIALDYLGLTEVLAESFDLDEFRRIKASLMIGLMASSKTNVSDREIVEALGSKYGPRVLHLRVISYLWFLAKKVLPDSLKWRSMAKTPYLW